MTVSKRMIDQIHEPYFERVEKDFRQGAPGATKELEISYLAANLASIAFYDSIIVFEKKKRGLPQSELR